MHIEEENDSRSSQRDLLRKYAELSTLSQFLKTFDTTVFGKLHQVNDYLDREDDFRDEQEAAAMEDAMDETNEQVR